MEPCANCLSPLEPTYRFCPNCGQKKHWRRFTLPDIFREFTQAFTDLDKGVPHLVGQLAIRPGIAAREYILEGKRKKYFNPFSFLLLVLGLYLSVTALTHPYTRVEKPPEPTSAQRPVTHSPTSGSGARERQRQVQTLLEEYANLVGLLAIPLFAGIYYLYFRSSKIYYAEHLVAIVFFSSFYSIVSLLTILLLGFIFRKYLPFLNFIQLAFEWVYLTLAYYQFLGYRHPKQYLTTSFATLLALLTWMVLTGGAISYYIRHGW